MAAERPLLTGDLLGLEQEFIIRRGRRRVDFRRWVHRVAEKWGAVCPAGPCGYFLHTGALLICDGGDAEIALPPERPAPGTFQRLATTAAARRRELTKVLDAILDSGRPPLTAHGYSTHFSLSCTGVCTTRAASTYARTMAPAMMLLLDVRTSPGLLVRPRSRRLEVGGDYAPPNDALSAASLFFTASALAVIDAAVHAGPSHRLPLAFDATRLERARQRDGFFVDRAAFGDDLYERGRRAVLRRDGGATVDAQSALELSWAHARPFAEAIAGAGELELVDRLILGSAPLPCEADDPDAYLHTPPPDASAPAEDANEFTRALRPMAAGGWSLTPEVATWDFIVYRAKRDRDEIFINVPRSHLARWLSDLGDGDVTRWSEPTAAMPARLSLADAEQPGAFADLDKAGLTARFDSATSQRKKKPPDDLLCAVVVHDKSIEICIPATTDPQQPKGPQEPPQSDWTLAHDVWAHNGAYHHTHVDHQVRSIGFNVAFTRVYRSSVIYDGILGQNWDHLYNIRVVPHPPRDPNCFTTVPGGWCERFTAGCQGGDLTYYHGTGRVSQHAFRSWEVREVLWVDAQCTAIVTTYQQNPGENFYIERYAILQGEPPPAVTEPIFYRIRVRGGTRILLNCYGYVVEIRDRNLNRMRFHYGYPQNPLTAYFTLSEFTDTLDRPYRIDYKDVNGVPRIEYLTDPWNRKIQYHYDAEAQLERVSLVKGDFGRPELVYKYGGGARVGLLTRIINPAEVAGSMTPVIVNHYDGDERVDWQRVEGVAPPGVTVPTCGGRFTIQYPSAVTRTVIDRAQTPWTYTLKSIGVYQVVQAISVEDEVFDGTAVVTKPLVTSYDHDDHFHITSIKYPSGRSETFKYSNQNQPLVQPNTELDNLFPRISHYNDLRADDLLTHTMTAAGGATSIDTSFEYEYLFNRVEKIETPHGTWKNVYDNDVFFQPELSGNAIQVTHPPQLLPDGTTAPGDVTEDMDYGLGGALTNYRDPDGVEHDYVLDSEGRVERHEIHGVTQESFDFDARGNTNWRYDARGNAWFEEHDDRDNRVMTVDPLQHETDYTYDLNDRLVKEEHDIYDDPTTIQNVPAQPVVSVSVETTHDTQGNRIQMTQRATGAASGATQRTWQWHYDANECLRADVTPRAVAGQRADARKAFGYNKRCLLNSITVAAGGASPGTTQIGYDEDDRPARTVDALNEIRLQAFDPLGRPTVTTLPNSATIHREYRGEDPSREWMEGEISQGPASLGYTIATGVLGDATFRFDHNRRLIAKTEKVFEPLQRAQPSVPVALEAKHETWYTKAGRLKKNVDPAGNAVVHDYDSQGRLKIITLPGAHTTAFTYDGPYVDSATQTLNPDAGTTEQPPPATLTLTEKKTYDELGRLVDLTGADGVRVQFAYDSVGRKRAMLTTLALTVYEYDGLSRVASQTVSNVLSDSNTKGTVVIRYDHDLNDNVTLLQDDLQRATRTSYDGRDLPLTVDQPQQPSWTFERRADGTIDAVVRGQGRRVKYDYTPTGEVSRIVFRDGGNRSDQIFGHDGAGRLTWALDSNGTQTRSRVQTYRTVDSLGRITSERTVIPEFNFDQTVGYAFGQSFTDRTINYPGNPPIAYEFGPDANLKRMTELGLPLIQKWHQGPARLIETERYPQLAVQQPQFQAFKMRLREGFRYNGVGQLYRRTLRLTDEINSPSPAAGPNYLNLLPMFGGAEKLNYGTDGMIADRIFDDYTNTSHYDGAGRLLWTLEEELPSRKLTEFDWDGGNRLHKIETTDFTGRTTRPAQTTRDITYASGKRDDAIGSRSLSWTFDGQGRLSLCADTLGRSLQLRGFTYDAVDRVQHIRIDDRGARRATTHAHYLYDALGRRVARVAGSGRVPFMQRDREIFLFDGPHCILEYDAQGRDTRRYVYDEAGALVAFDQMDPATGMRKAAVLPMNLLDGSPSLLLSRDMRLTQLPAPPGAGAPASARADFFRTKIPFILERQIWRPFSASGITRFDYQSGTAVGRLALDSLLPVNASRRIHKPETLYNSGIRFYDPELQAFITPDTLGAWGDPHALGNPLTSAANNPSMMRDTGQLAFIPILIYIGVTLLIAAVETGVEYGICRVTGTSEDFDPIYSFAKNFGIGLATNWIPFGALGRVSGRLTARVAMRGLAAAGARSAFRYAAGRLAWKLGAFTARTAITAGADALWEASPLGRGQSFQQIAAGHAVGGIMGTALHRVLGRAVRGLSRVVEDVQLRRAYQWLADPAVAVGEQRFIGERQGKRLLERAAKLGLENEFGLIRLPNGRTLVRKGEANGIDILMNEFHYAHYHPSGGPWSALRRRLPAPRDIELAAARNEATGTIFARFAEHADAVGSSVWWYNPSGTLRILADHGHSFSIFDRMLEVSGAPRRVGNVLEFRSLEEYNRLFMQMPLWQEGLRRGF